MNAFLTAEIELLVRPYDTDLTHARRVKKKKMKSRTFNLWYTSTPRLRDDKSQDLCSSFLALLLSCAIILLPL